MKLTIQCLGCQSTYRIAEHHLQGKPVRFLCRKCQRAIVLKPTPLGLDVEGGIIQSIFRTHLPPQFSDLSGVERLASGGMGEVYLATMSGAEGFTRKVALKVLHPHLSEDVSFVQVMVEEAKLTVLLNHPNIVQVYNLRKYNDLLYLVMEYVAGKSLNAVSNTYHQRGAQVPVNMVVYILCQVLQGLAYAHELNDGQGCPLQIVHRDISPQNILITKEGWVKIIDFGIAKAATRLGQTSPGILKGKMAYTAPEQLKGQVDARSDLFAVGVLLWESLTGIPLFLGPSELATMHKLMVFEPGSIPSIRPEVTPALDAIARRALAKEPDARFQTAREFEAALREVVLPATLEELRQQVDIDATLYADRTAVVAEPINLSLDNTPVSAPQGRSPGTSPPAADPGPQKDGKPRRRPLMFLLAALALVLGISFISLTRFRQGPRPAAPLAVPTPSPPSLRAESAALAPPESPTPAIQPSEEKKPSTLPKLAHKVIAAAVRKRSRELQGCADVHLTKGPQGQDLLVVLEFRIDARGAVLEAHVNPRDLENAPFGRCLLEQLRKVRFPRHPDKAITIGFPLTFKVLR